MTARLTPVEEQVRLETLMRQEIRGLHRKNRRSYTYAEATGDDAALQRDDEGLAAIITLARLYGVDL